MNAFAAIELSTVNQAIFQSIYGDMYILTLEPDDSLSAVRRKKKHLNNYCWSKGNPWKSIEYSKAISKGKNNWKPVLPKK